MLTHWWLIKGRIAYLLNPDFVAHTLLWLPANAGVVRLEKRAKLRNEGYTLFWKASERSVAGQRGPKLTVSERKRKLREYHRYWRMSRRLAKFTEAA